MKTYQLMLYMKIVAVCSENHMKHINVLCGKNVKFSLERAMKALHPGKSPGTHCIGGWVGPRASLDWCGKSRPHRDSIPGASCP